MEIIKKKKSIPKPTYFGVNLKLLRRLNAMSQKDLATALNLTRNKIASYESGIVEPNANLFLEVSTFFKVDPKEMLSTVFTNKIVDSMRTNTKDPDGTSDHLLQAIETFIEKTNEMTKIMNGYKAMTEIKNPLAANDSDKSLHRAFFEILELFELLIHHNWKLINQIIKLDSDVLKTEYAED